LERLWRLLALGALLIGLVGSVSAAAEPPRPASRASPAVMRARLQRSLAPEQACDLAYLEHLGWRVVAGAPGTGVTTHGGYATRHRTIQEAQQAGLLQIRVAPDATPAQLREGGTSFRALGDGLASRLAFKHKLWRATYQATKKLDANTKRGNYRFPQVLMFESLWFKMVPPQPEWQRGKWHSVAKARPSVAVSTFYTRPAVMECYTGQWVAMYATQYELFGPQAFDAAFKPEELVLGRPRHMVDTPLGRYLKEENSGIWRAVVLGPEHYGQDPGVALASLGPVAWSGASGVLENVEPDLATNDNFIVVTVSPRVNEFLLNNGGLRYIVKKTEQIWAIHERYKRGAIRGSSGLAAQERIEKILDHPVFQEMIIYIHPDGVVPLKVGFTQRIGRTHRPLKMRIYRNGVANAFYERYRSHFLRCCRSGVAAAQPPFANPTGGRR
jgi:hypothetical protein